MDKARYRGSKPLHDASTAYTIALLGTFSKPTQDQLISDIKRIEKKTFPQSEALDFDAELKKRNTRVFVALSACKDGIRPQVKGYLVYLRLRRTTLMHKICVVEQHRQEGIGKAMISALLQRLRNEGSDTTQLWVDESRLPARRLYASCAFHQVDHVVDYYGPGRTGLKMVHELHT
ncbi:hypothetical protein LTR66_014263 [Elasticomyces elasticus]|nr:hypothetical protein LTR66_014263 [Elasticomyces elasticus]